MVISDKGKVRLSRALVPTGSMAAARVWDLARGADGAVYAATGDAGKVYRRVPGEASSWEVALDAADSQALSLAITPDNKVYVGTGPTGQVVEVSDPKHPASRPDPKVQYVWDLAADAQGNLFAATGPNGQLWKRDPRRRVVARLRQQGDAPAFRGRRARGRGLRRQRRRRADLSGRP